MENLRMLREKKRITQVSLSTYIGIAQETISAYESGKSFPSVEVLIRLADHLGTSTDFLLDRPRIVTPIERLTVNDLQADELELITEYKKLSHEQKGRALGFILGMLE